MSSWSRTNLSLVSFVCFFPCVSSGALRILPLGDSLTAGFHDGSTGSYRYALEQHFLLNGIEYDFLGSQRRGAMLDPDHEGHGGWRIEQIATIDVAAMAPDVVLLMAGTNNHWDEPVYADFEARYSQVFDSVGNVPTIVATLPGFGFPRSDTAYWTSEWVAERNDVRFPLMNQVIQDLASHRPNISVVDFANVFDANEHLFTDQVHLNTAGQLLLGDMFARELDVIGVPEPSSVVPMAALMLTIGPVFARKFR